MGSRAPVGSGAGSTVTCPAGPTCTPPRRSAPACRSIGSGVPLHMLGQQRRATAVPPGRPGFGGGTAAEDLRLYDAIRSVATPAGRGPWHDALSGAFRDQVDVAARLTPILPSDPSDGLIGRLARSRLG
jgi:hypothetical protein